MTTHAGYPAAPAAPALGGGVSPVLVNVLPIVPEAVLELLKEEANQNQAYFETLKFAYEVAQASRRRLHVVVAPDESMSAESFAKLVIGAGRIEGFFGRDALGKALSTQNTCDALHETEFQTWKDRRALLQEIKNAPEPKTDLPTQLCFLSVNSAATLIQVGKHKPEKFILAGAAGQQMEDMLGFVEWIAGSTREQGMVMVSAPDSTGNARQWLFSARWLHLALAYKVGHVTAEESELSVDTFLASMESKDTSTCIDCLEKVGSAFFRNQPDMLKKVMVVLGTNDSWSVKLAAMSTLQRVSNVIDGPTMDILEKQLHHPLPAVQLLVANVLKYIQKESASDACNSLLSSRPHALNAVGQRGSALAVLPPQFRQDKEVVMTAVSQDGNALKFADESLRRDRDVVFAAVSQNGSAIDLAHQELIEAEERLQLVRDGRQNGQVIGLCEDYLIFEEIGKGVYGSVTRAKHMETGQVVAIKKLHYDPEAWADGIPAHALREVSLLKDFSHPNIVALKDVIEKGSGMQDFRLVFEYSETDLHQVLREKRKAGQVLPIEQVRKYTADLIAGIHACHGRCLVHRDLKPQNVLVDQDGSPFGILKIADFGLARMLSSPLRPYTLDIVTLWYRAPEILLGTPRYGFEVDMWSVGCIIGELASGRPLFPGDSEIGTIFKIFGMLGTPCDSNWKEAMNLEHFKMTFPKWAGTGFDTILQIQPALREHDGLELLGKLLCFDPKVRITSRKAKTYAFCQS